ncbi:hypothetical protein GCM10023197_06570 [Gordonia humi]
MQRKPKPRRAVVSTDDIDGSPGRRRSAAINHRGRNRVECWAGTDGGVGSDLALEEDQGPVGIGDSERVRIVDAIGVAVVDGGYEYRPDPSPVRTTSETSMSIVSPLLLVTPR